MAFLQKVLSYIKVFFKSLLSRRTPSKGEENLYIKILLWAYGKSQDGFTRREMTEEFGLEGNIDSWVQKIFFSGTNSSRPIIGHFKSTEKNGENIDYFMLTDKGMSTAIDYIELKEARESSQKAIKIATWSFGVAITVGIFQIGIQIFC